MIVLETATSILSSVAIAAISAWITVQLSVRKFRSERWWERKVEAYERIIEALHQIKAVEAYELSAHYQMREIPEETDKELNNRVKPAYQEMQRSADVGAFLLSVEAHERIVRYQKEIEEAWGEDLQFNSREAALLAAKNCLKEFIVIARKELGNQVGWVKLMMIKRKAKLNKHEKGK